MYSSGNKARDNLSLSKRYYEPLNTDTSYWVGWLGILGLGVDYFNGGGGANQGMDTNIGYDRYGRAQFALRATYSLTAALAVYGVVAPTWTAEKVDTDTGCPALTVATSALGCTSRFAINSNSFAKGDSTTSAPRLTVDSPGALRRTRRLTWPRTYLVAGHALDMTEQLNGNAVERDARDGYCTPPRV